MEENQVKNSKNEVSQQDDYEIDIGKVEESLEKDFNCVGINFFKHGKYQFVKAYEKDIKAIRYRYFNINSKTNQVKEVEDSEILNYFRKKYEPVLERDYGNKK